MSVKKKKYDPDVWAPPTPTSADEKAVKNGKAQPGNSNSNSNAPALSKFQQRFQNKAVVVSKDGIGAQLPSVQTEAEGRSSVPHADHAPAKPAGARAEQPRGEAEQQLVLPPPKQQALKKGKISSSPPGKDRPLPKGTAEKHRGKVAPLDAPDIEAVQRVDAAAAAAARGQQGSTSANLHTLASSPLRAPVTYIAPSPPPPPPPPAAVTAVASTKPSNDAARNKTKRATATAPKGSSPPPPSQGARAGATALPKHVPSGASKKAPSADGPQRKSANANSKKGAVEEKGEEQQQQQPSYTPYTLEDYHQLRGESPLPKSGGLGPNDTDAQREAAERKKRQMQYGLKASQVAREALQQEIEKQQQKAEEKRRSSASGETRIYKGTQADAAANDEDEEDEEGAERTREAGQSDADERTSEAFAPTPPSGASSDRMHSSGEGHRLSGHRRKKRFSVIGPQQSKQTLAAQARRQKALAYAREVAAAAPAPAPAAEESTRQQRGRSGSSASHTGPTDGGLAAADREAERREQRRLDLEAKHDRNKAAVDLIRRQLNM